jgi:hypothetical protein
MSKQRKMYHTQGYSEPYLTKPIICIKNNAWLGHAYYFWDEEEDAISWGMTAKKNYSRYSVYTGDIDLEDVLNTVFEESHYKLWRSSIDKAAKALSMKTGRKPTIDDVNAYLIQRGGWGEKVTGIMFQDLPANETISKIVGLYYRKRIQLAAFKTEIITNFAHHFDGDR